LPACSPKRRATNWRTGLIHDARFARLAVYLALLYAFYAAKKKNMHVQHLIRPSAG